MRSLLLAALLVGCGPGVIGDVDGEPGESLVDPLESDAGGDARTEPPQGDAGTPSDDASPELDGAPAGEDASTTPDASPPPDTAPPPSDTAKAADTAPPPPTGPLPPALPSYSKGACPKLTWASTSGAALNVSFATGSHTRQFRLMVPKSYDGKSDYPLLVAYHWLNASSAAFAKDAELESAIDQLGFIVALPDRLSGTSGEKAYKFDWPFYETSSAPSELLFFDDMLACISAQLRIDRRRVHVVGVSAGALWTTYLSSTTRAKWIASIETLSGGLGSMYGWSMSFTPQPNKFPALVLWGGPKDVLGIDFHAASTKLRDALVGDGHFVVSCMHDAGHVMPPIPVPSDGTTRFRALWKFLLDHPYGLPKGDSPYRTTGLPASFPSWCSIAK